MFFHCLRNSFSVIYAFKISTFASNQAFWFFFFVSTFKISFLVIIYQERFQPFCDVHFLYFKKIFDKSFLSLTFPTISPFKILLLRIFYFFFLSSLSMPLYTGLFPLLVSSTGAFYLHVSFLSPPFFCVSFLFWRHLDYLMLWKVVDKGNAFLSVCCESRRPVASHLWRERLTGCLYLFFLALKEPPPKRHFEQN